MVEQEILGGWKIGDWLGWLGWMVTFPPVNGELDVNRLGTSRLEVDEVVEVDGVGVVGFPVVVRIPYDGFLLGFGVVTPDGDKTPGGTIQGCSRRGGY